MFEESAVHSAQYAKFVGEVQSVLSAGASAAILGFTSLTIELLNALKPNNLLQGVEAIYVSDEIDYSECSVQVPVRRLADLRESTAKALIVADDERKEELLMEASPFISGVPRVILAGYDHFRFKDALFEEELARLEVPSLANGYPHSLVHLFQCLQNAARLRLEGVVAEFGVFRGGTTMFLSRVIERLGAKWHVIGFDTFSGFPAPRSLFDMYNHEGCVCTDLAAVQGYLAGRDVELVIGDIAETYKVLEGEQIVLSFMDTDNFTPAMAALELVREQTVIGGAIVFDHFTGIDRFRYTLGERIAGKTLLDDSRYFHLHGTGVFYRQR